MLIIWTSLKMFKSLSKWKKEKEKKKCKHLDKSDQHLRVGVRSWLSPGIAREVCSRCLLLWTGDTLRLDSGLLYGRWSSICSSKWGLRNFFKRIREWYWVQTSQTARRCKTSSVPTYRFFRRLSRVRTVRGLRHALCALPWLALLHRGSPYFLYNFYFWQYFKCAITIALLFDLLINSIYNLRMEKAGRGWKQCSCSTAAGLAFIPSVEVFW